MLMKNLFLLFCCVCSVFSFSAFIGNNERAELFELTDNEVAVFNVTIPDDEFSLLKERAVYGLVEDEVFGVNSLQDIRRVMGILLLVLKMINYTEYYPDYNCVELFPELKINEDGFSQIDDYEVLNSFDYDIDHYSEEEQGNFEFLLIAIAKSNPDFRFIDIITKIKDMPIVDGVPLKEDIENYFNIFYETKIKKYEITKSQQPNEVANKASNNIHDFKTKNATLVVEINGEKKSFNKVTFKLGGKKSRSYSKVPFNLKIRGGKDLYGRSQFKLRPDSTEPTLLRTKLVSDIHNRLGLKSVSSNYITLYINNENMGLYILNDAYKLSWVKQVYGEDDATNLYHCESLYDFKPEYASGCLNENEDISDFSDFSTFLKAVKDAQSASDLEEIFDIDHFLAEMALEYLLGSWDHLHNEYNSHNFYLYKQPNGKWIYLSYDFDLDFGYLNNPTKSYNIPFNEFFIDLHIIDILILRDPTRFEKILKDIVDKVFNPATLYPHIDEVKAFIKPYVEKDKTPDASGNYPGRINTKGNEEFSLEQWDANTEYTPVFNSYFGLKFWTLIKYRYVCDLYNMECDPVYMDENFEYTVNTNVGTVEDYIYVRNNTVTATTTVVDSTTNVIKTPAEMETETTTISSNATPVPSNEIKCWSELEGYSCCPSGINKVYAQDEYGDWSFDFKTNEWCGLTLIEESVHDVECWSEEFGYPCCKGCKVIVEDSNGSWGYELNHWCGVQLYCKN